MKQYLNYIFLMVFTLAVLAKASKAQTSVNGPTCVTTGIKYLYAIKGDEDTGQIKKACVIGGVIESSNNGCIEGKRLKYIKVNWDSSAVKGSINYSSAFGSTTISVAIVKPLSGGILQSDNLVQVTDATKTPVTIHCSPAIGGSCTPSYLYQWEQSADNISWVAVNGATAKDLTLSVPIKQTTYYRRKVKTSDSDVIEYSNSSIVLITPPANQQ